MYNVHKKHRTLIDGVPTTLGLMVSAVHKSLPIKGYAYLSTHSLLHIMVLYIVEAIEEDQRDRRSWRIII